MSFLSLSRISKTFASAIAVEDFNLSVESGEFISFLGPSGCGKTTTLRMIAGFEQPTSGSITIAGQDVTHKPANQRNIGMVFQSYALFPNMTVADNIGFGLKVTRKPASQIKQTVAEMLDVIQLPNVGQRYPHQLSGGQQQRVALARALAIHPQVLLLDEPLSALDAKIRVELRNEIRRIQRQLAITTIYVTHDQEEALSLSDRIVVMNAGCVEQIGPPFEIYNYPSTAFTASFIGQLNLLPVRIADANAGVCLIAGQAVQVTPPIEGANGSAARLAIRPEELSLLPVEALQPPELNALRAHVDSVTFLGSIVRVKAVVDSTGGETKESISLAVDLFNDRLLAVPQAGEPTQLVFAPHACWMIAA